MYLYGLKPRTYDSWLKRIKEAFSSESGKVRITGGVSSKRKTISEMRKFGSIREADNEMNIKQQLKGTESELSLEELQLLVLPEGDMAMRAYVWCKDFFNLVVVRITHIFS